MGLLILSTQSTIWCRRNVLRLSTLRTNCYFGHRNLPEYQHRQNIATFPIIFESLLIILDQLFSPVIQPSLKDYVLRYQSKTPLLILLLLLILLVLKYETTLGYQKDKRLF